MMMGIQTGGQKMPMFKPSARMFALLPRLVRFISNKWAFSRQIDKRLPEVKSRYQMIAAQQSRQIDDAEHLEKIEQLKSITGQTAYLNIVAPLLMALYNGMLRRQMLKAGSDYEKLDLMDGVPALQDYDPDFHLRRLNGLYCQLSPDTQQRILESSFTAFQLLPGIEDFQAQVTEFLERFGHLSDSGNDFSSIPWRENPDLILRMITSYTQREAKPGEKLTFDQIPVIGLCRWRMAWTYRNAQRYRLYREQISSVYTYGYGLFRESYLALGDSLVRRDILADREDIFYLYDPEIRSFFAGEASGEDFAEKVSQRKQEMEQFRNVELPELIYGDHPPPVQLSTSQVLRGTPTSRGYYTGQVKNVRGISDFPKVVKGDVIVVPYSDVGWTPLFARAGAVIAESGGILSHSSIIAREYNIPAVVSVAGALQLNDHTRVTVDGYKGEIVIHEPGSIPG
jgi:pyruvate,water dikinase